MITCNDETKATRDSLLARCSQFSIKENTYYCQHLKNQFKPSGQFDQNRIQQIIQDIIDNGYDKILFNTDDKIDDETYQKALDALVKYCLYTTRNGTYKDSGVSWIPALIFAAIAMLSTASALGKNEIALLGVGWGVAIAVVVVLEILYYVYMERPRREQLKNSIRENLEADSGRVDISNLHSDGKDGLEEDTGHNDYETDGVEMVSMSNPLKI